MSDDTLKTAILHASLLNIGRLLPHGMEVSFFRNEGEPVVRMQHVMPDGSVTDYAFAGHSPIVQVPETPRYEPGRATYDAYDSIYPPLFAWDTTGPVSRERWARMEEKIISALATPTATDLADSLGPSETPVIVTINGERVLVTKAEADAMLDSMQSSFPTTTKGVEA